ncbi:hypothetical protein RND71_016848 [Anisodus tanguticus]|uniref:DUF7890 domain-containing protein n=1 Tax=Anisodus tanguticus TaxID=243964 RepID=A0AAE1S8M4_9SOLA|nr:hypothetical protein RND71_016848 [Anisodus tanguticus]
MVKIMGLASSMLKEIGFGKINNSKKTNKVESSSSSSTIYVCRDELDKKKPKIKKQVKFDLEPKCQPQEEASTLLELNKKSGTSLEKYKVGGGGGDDRANSGRIKVKILMRKEDAAKLLSKCKEGGVLEFMDVAQELVQVPSSSIRFLSSPNHNTLKSHDCSLKTIPEES